MGSGHVHAAPLGRSIVGRLDARAKLAAVIPAILVSNLVPRDKWQAVVLIGALFAVLIVSCGRGALRLFARSAYLLPFVLFVLVTVPFSAAGDEVFAINLGFARLVATDDGLRRAAEVALKAGTSIAGVLLLTGTTEAPELFKGLRGLGAPAAFVAITSTVYRYVFEIGDEFSRLRRAAAARCFQMKDVRALPRMGTMAASLLVRSVERSERVHHAMLARGYDGEVRTLGHGNFGAREWSFVAGFAAVILIAGAIAIYA